RGQLASYGEWGEGRLAEPPEILAAIEEVLAERAASSGLGTLRGVRVLVTAGGTREPIDSVRYVGNRSSGRMGFALADEAARRGGDVTVVAANVSLPHTPGIHYIDVETAADLEQATARAFEAGDNEVTILTRHGDHPVARAPKEEVARAIVDQVEALRADGTPASEEVSPA